MENNAMLEICGDEIECFVVEYCGADLSIEFREETDEQCVNLDDVEANTGLEDAVIDAGLVWDIFDEYSLGAQGTFDTYVIREEMCHSALEMVDANAESYVLISYALMTDGSKRSVIQISFAEMIKRMIQDQADYGDFDARVSHVVEDSLLAFEEEASWRVGLSSGEMVLADVRSFPKPCLNDDGCISWIKDGVEYWPILWFGLEDEDPIPVWTIDSKEPDFGLWDKTCQSWEFIQSVASTDECFLIWYTGECACAIPDLEWIMEKCPVSVFDSDADYEESPQILRRLLDQYLMKLIQDIQSE